MFALGITQTSTGTGLTGLTATGLQQQFKPQSTGLQTGLTTAPKTQPIIGNTGLPVTTTAAASQAKKYTYEKLEKLVDQVLNTQSLHVEISQYIPANKPCTEHCIMCISFQWSRELLNQERVFMQQAQLVGQWDTMLQRNGDRIISLHDHIDTLKSDQSK